jgi:hypothetical protein
MRLSLLVAILGAACAPSSSPPANHPGSRGMRADAHLDAAREHARRASELARWPETRPDGNGVVNDPATGLWYRRFDTARDEERIAASHRSAAARLQAEYEAACGTNPASEVAISPLQRYGVGGENLIDGVVIFLDPSAGPSESLMAAIRCHRAWMMLGESGMESCPLDLADLRVAAHGDAEGISVQITTANPAVVPELQRRAAAELEHASRREANAH